MKSKCNQRNQINNDNPRVAEYQMHLPEQIINGHINIHTLIISGFTNTTKDASETGMHPKLAQMND